MTVGTDRRKLNSAAIVEFTGSRANPQPDASQILEASGFCFMDETTSTMARRSVATPTLVSPLPMTWIPLLWEWSQENPAANLDDSSPTSRQEFETMMRERIAHERSWGVLLDGVPVGVIAYLPMTPRLGVFHGICFTQRACGIGVARSAVQQVLDELFAHGVEKVCAYFFATNIRVRRFFDRLGAVPEGLQRAQTTQGGHPIDLQLMALFRKAG